MKKEFLQKVVDRGSVDTKNYRYRSVVINGVDEQHVEIRRLPIADLDTTAAIDGWETVTVLGAEF